MFNIRRATMDDIPGIQACDFNCFPEEDPRDSFYYEDCILFWPKLFYVAEDQRAGGILGSKDQGTGGISGSEAKPIGGILGYVIAKMVGEHHGYISYLGVHPTAREQGIAKKLMAAAEKALVQEYGSEYVSLHVRVQEYGPEYVSFHVRRNKFAAINLFTENLGYRIQKTAAAFYDNGEDAHLMRKQLQPIQAGRQVTIEAATMVGQTRNFEENNYRGATPTGPPPAKYPDRGSDGSWSPLLHWDYYKFEEDNYRGDTPTGPPPAKYPDWGSDGFLSCSSSQYWDYYSGRWGLYM